MRISFVPHFVVHVPHVPHVPHFVVHIYPVCRNVEKSSKVMGSLEPVGGVGSGPSVDLSVRLLIKICRKILKGG